LLDAHPRSQLGVPFADMEKHTSDLLNIKKTIGLPDARFDASGMQECQLSDLETNTSIACFPARATASAAAVRSTRRELSGW